MYIHIFQSGTLLYTIVHSDFHMYQFHIIKDGPTTLVIFTFMQLTLPPLLAMEVISVLLLRVTGNAADDFKPVNGATMVAWAGEVATAAEESIEEAITTSFSLFSYLLVCLFLWSSIYSEAGMRHKALRSKSAGFMSDDNVVTCHRIKERCWHPYRYRPLW